MLVIRCKNPNSAEVELIKALAPLDGIAIFGYMVAQGDREREIDAILITPVRAVAIEVKAPQLGTPNKGELVPNANSPWTIGGETAWFHGTSNKHNPVSQAKTAAQIFATFIRGRMSATPFVQVAVSVANSDGEMTMSKGPMMAGQTAVAFTPNIVEGLDLMRKKEVPLSMALEMLEVMALGVLKPTKEDVEAEWANATTLLEGIPTYQKPSPKNGEKQGGKSSSKDMPLAVVRPRTPFFERMEVAMSAFRMATVIFLLIWFLYTIGILSATIELFDSLQELVSEAVGTEPHVPEGLKEITGAESPEELEELTKRNKGLTGDSGTAPKEK